MKRKIIAINRGYSFQLLAKDEFGRTKGIGDIEADKDRKRIYGETRYEIDGKMMTIPQVKAYILKNWKKDQQWPNL